MARRGATRRDTTRHDNDNDQRKAVGGGSGSGAAQRVDGGAAAGGGGGLWLVGRGAHVIFICFVQAEPGKKRQIFFQLRVWSFEKSPKCDSGWFFALFLVLVVIFPSDLKFSTKKRLSVF